jgi:hypothetical protein
MGVFSNSGSNLNWKILYPSVESSAHNICLLQPVSMMVLNCLLAQGFFGVVYE